MVTFSVRYSQIHVGHLAGRLAGGWVLTQRYHQLDLRLTLRYRYVNQGRALVSIVIINVVIRKNIQGAR